MFDMGFGSQPQQGEPIMPNRINDETIFVAADESTREPIRPREEKVASNTCKEKSASYHCDRCGAEMIPTYSPGYSPASGMRENSINGYKCPNDNIVNFFFTIKSHAKVWGNSYISAFLD
jgi:hypothetical protein